MKTDEKTPENLKIEALKPESLKPEDLKPETLINLKAEVQADSSAEQIIDRLTLFDDELMSLVFDGNIEGTELLLRIILESSAIRVISVAGQRELKSPFVGGRMIRLDILAQDETGRHFNIEVQKSDEGTHYRRARFHSSMLDARMLRQSQKFKELPDSYVIFITEHDVVGAGLPLYHFSRMIEETQEPLQDGSHIIYVNGSYRGSDPVGKLIHDFRCKDSKDMYYQELSQGVQQFKETEGGRKNMSEIVEAYAREKARVAAAEATKKALKEVEKAVKKAEKAEKAAKEAAESASEEKAESVALKMLRAGKYALEEIANLTDLSLSQVQMLQKKI